MTGRELRARVLLEEARVLGLDLADLIAADPSGAVAFPTVRSSTRSPRRSPRRQPPPTGPIGVC